MHDVTVNYTANRDSVPVGKVAPAHSTGPRRTMAALVDALCRLRDQRDALCPALRPSRVLSDLVALATYLSGVDFSDLSISYTRTYSVPVRVRCGDGRRLLVSLVYDEDEPDTAAQYLAVVRDEEGAVVASVAGSWDYVRRGLP